MHTAIEVHPQAHCASCEGARQTVPSPLVGEGQGEGRLPSTERENVHRHENGGLHFSGLRYETDAVRAVPLSLSLSLPHKGGGNDVAPLCPIANRHSRTRRHAGALFLSALVALVLTLTGSAAHADDFYRGKTISLIIGSNTSGGYDTYGRLLARHT